MATTIKFTDVDLAKAAKFAEESAPTTYNRRGEKPSDHERNSCIGKLGEIAFAKFLSDNGKALIGNDDMFTVWNDTLTVDKMDFQTTNGKTIDVKTASRSFHRNILVPYDQYLRQPKDYYVGVRISEDESTATIIGFAAWNELTPFGRGDYPAYGRLLDELQPIKKLLEMIPDVKQDKI